MQTRIRIAPTPSGFLHLGNLLNFSLIRRVAETAEFEICLRIDDVDQARVRPEYVDDIFQKLNALGISWAVGPQSATDLSLYSQQIKISQYWEALTNLQNLSQNVFVCECSRTERVSGFCVRSCQEKNLKFKPQQNQIRIRLQISGMEIEDTLWRKENLPAYHLTDIVDDKNLGITHVIRGADLIPSTILQTELRKILQIEIPKYAFHPLVEMNKTKLSKSTGTNHFEVNQTQISWIAHKTETLLPEMLKQFASPNLSVSDFDSINID